MISVDELIKVLQENYNSIHGVIETNKVIEALKNRKVDIPESFLKLCESCTPDCYGYAALHGLFQLAFTGQLSEVQANRLLAIAHKEPYGIFNDGEFYKCVRYLSANSKYHKVIMQFVERLLDEKKDFYWRDHLFEAINIMLGKNEFEVSENFIEKMTNVVDQENDLKVQNQFMKIILHLKSRIKN